MVQLLLQWQQMTCDRCGDLRLRGQRCALCDAKPDEREFDAYLSRRAPAAQKAAALLATSASQDSWQASRTIPPFDGFENFFDEFFAAAQAVGDNQRDRGQTEARLLDVVARLRSLKASSAGAIRLRPWIDAWSTFDAVAVAIERMVAVVLDAMQATTQREALRSRDIVQPAIDEAEQALADWGGRIARIERLGLCEDEAEVATALLVEAAAVVQGDLLALDSYGSALSEARFGTGVPAGLGVALAVSEVQIGALFDSQRFWRVAKQIVDATADGVAPLPGDPLWHETFNQAQEKLFTAVRSFTLLVNGAGKTDDELHAAITLAADLVEGPGRRLLAVALAAANRTAIGHFASRDAGALIHTAGQQKRGSWIEGFEKTLRHARAHLAYVIVDDEIELADGTRWSRESLLDTLLAALESVAALQLALLVASSTHGNAVDELVAYDRLFPDAVSAAKALCAASGWADVEVNQLGGVLSIAGATDAEVSASFAASLLAVVTDPDVTEVVLQVMHDGATTVIRGPVEPHRRFSSAKGELAKGAELLRISRSWTQDGHEFLTSDHVTKWVAMMVGPLLTASPRVRKDSLACLHELCRDLGEDELVRYLSHVQGAVRAATLGLPASRAERAAIDFFAEWEKIRLETDVA